MFESLEHYTEWKEAETEEFISDASICVKFKSKETYPKRMAVRLCWTCLCPVPTASAQGNFTEDGMGGESAGLPAPQKTRQSQGGGRQVRGGWGAQGRQRDRETRLKAKKKGRIWDLESCICRNFSSSRKYLRVFFFNVSRLF